MTYRQFHKMQLDIIIIILFSQPRLRAESLRPLLPGKGLAQPAGRPGFKQPRRIWGHSLPTALCRDMPEVPLLRGLSKENPGDGSLCPFSVLHPRQRDPRQLLAREEAGVLSSGGSTRPGACPHLWNTSSPAPFGHPAWSYLGLPY